MCKRVAEGERYPCSTSTEPVSRGGAGSAAEGRRGHMLHGLALPRSLQVGAGGGDLSRLPQWGWRGALPSRRPACD